MKSTIRKAAASFVTAASLIAGGATAQQKVSYTLAYDDPLAFKKLFVNINLLQIDLASPTEWRPGLGVEFTLNRRLYFFAEHNRSIFPFATVYSTQPRQTYTEAGTIFSLTSAVKTKNAKIRSRSGGYNYRMKIKANAHKQFGIHGGLNHFNTYKKSGSYYADVNTTSVFAGIAVTTTRDMVVSVGTDTYNRSSRGIWYLDVLIAPSITYKDATDYPEYVGSAAKPTPGAFPTFDKNPIGARMGYMKYKNWPIPLREGFEFGMRPGVGNGLYFALRADISIGFMQGKSASKTAENK